MQTLLRVLMVELSRVLADIQWGILLAETDGFD